MRALYEIDNEILACVDADTGEILDTEKLDALQMEREKKLEGVALWIKDLKAEADAVKAEADKLNARKKSLDNKIESIKTWLTVALDGTAEESQLRFLLDMSYDLTRRKDRSYGQL